MNVLGKYDVELFSSDTMIAWIRRPSPSHRNWWLCYYSTDEKEVRVWNWAVETVSKGLDIFSFHQGTWPHDHAERHPGCSEMFPYRCPGVVQAWEIWLGCSEWGLQFHDVPLQEIIDLGDPALEKVLAVAPAIRDKAMHAYAQR